MTKMPKVINRKVGEELLSVILAYGGIPCPTERHDCSDLRASELQQP